MKLVYRALVWSALLHLLYVAGEFVAGYVKTKSFEPDIAAKFDQVVVLQSEVAFGHTGSPLFFLVTYLSVAAVITIFLYVLKRNAV